MQCEVLQLAPDVAGMRCKRGIAGTTVLTPGSSQLCCS